METTTSRVMHAPPETIYPLAARVERWPAILPHYRWVRVLDERSATRRTVEMAAWRGLIPLHWVAVQELAPGAWRIHFTHIGGPTRGMEVEWSLVPLSADQTQVSIWHAFRPRWPLVPDTLVQAVVGELFVANVARKTLAALAALAEQAH